MEEFRQIEQNILSADDGIRRAYMKRREGFVNSVIRDNAAMGKEISRDTAYSLWETKFMRRYKRLNGE